MQLKQCRRKSTLRAVSGPKFINIVRDVIIRNKNPVFAAKTEISIKKFLKTVSCIYVGLVEMYVVGSFFYSAVYIHTERRFINKQFFPHLLPKLNLYYL